MERDNYEKDHYEQQRGYNKLRLRLLQIGVEVPSFGTIMDDLKELSKVWKKL